MTVYLDYKAGWASITTEYRIGTQELHMVYYSVVYSKTFNFADLNEVSNGNVFLT